MLRFGSLTTMAALFLLISPKLRGELVGCFESGLDGMSAHAPYSYIGAGALVLVLCLFTLYRGAQPQ